MDPALQELLEFGEATDEVAVVVRLRESAELPPGLHVVSRLGPIATARVERSSIWQIYGHPAILSIKAPRWLVSEYGPLIDREDAENVDVTDTDQRRPEGLEQTGRGVLIGVIDWGCDFAHPDFITDAGASRVRALWDQRAVRGDGNPYGYGRVLRQDALTAAVKADDPYAAAGYHPARSDTGVGAHGTHVMGIALGNGRSGGPLGLAPQAECAFVHLGAPGWEKTGPLGDSSNLLEALHFLVNEAGDRPLAINMSIGRHAGPHDGTTLVEQAIDWLVRTRPGTAVVQSTGNYFARNVHSAGQLMNGERDVLEFEVFSGDTTPNELEVWYSAHDVFGVALIAPDGHTAAEAKQSEKAPILADGARVGTLYHRARDPNNGDHHVNLFLYPNAPAGVWRLVLSGEDVSDGRYHAWVERDPGCRTCQSLFAPAHADYTSTTGSICNGLQTISVGAYDGHHPDHRLAPFSSSGPTRDGRVRPMLLAPGVRVLSARSHPRKGTASLLTRMSGTSMAAPHVTGTLALMLEAGGRLDIVRLRRALFESLAPVPSDSPRDRERTGFGVLDSVAAVRRAAELGGKAPDAPARKDGDAARALPPPAASDGSEGDAEAEAVVESPMAQSGIAPTPMETTTMNAACCGEPCKICEHCQDHDCATCPCCHGSEHSESAPEIQVVPSPLEYDEADEPVVQVVPSPFARGGEGDEWSDIDESTAADTWNEADEPVVQVVPSPFGVGRRGHETEADDTESPESPEAAVLAMGADETAPIEIGPAFPHPVDAAEALVESGVDDSTEFVAETLTASGYRWPARCNVRSLYDDLSGCTTPAQRLRMERHFEIVGRPGRAMGMALRAGDLVIRRGDGGFAYGAFVAHPVLYRESDARDQGLLLEGPWPGYYAHVVETGVQPRRSNARFARRVGHPDGIVLDDTLIVRPREHDADEGESLDTAEAAPDPNIRWLQAALNRAINAGLVVDGLIGPATRDAIRRYQAARGLSVDGIVGPQTLGALRAEAYGPSPGYTPPSTYTSPPPTPYEPPQAYPQPPSYEPPQRYPQPPSYDAPRAPAYPTPRRPYTPTPQPPYVPPRPPSYGAPRPPAYPAPRPPYTPPTPYASPQPPSYYTSRPPAYPPPRQPSYEGLRAYGAPDESVNSCRSLDRFGYDSASLTAEHRAAIVELAQRIVAVGATAVTVTGYASPEGTESYNLALGQRRADAVVGDLRQAIERVRPGASAGIVIAARSEGEMRQSGTDGPANRRVEVCVAEAPPRRPPGPRPGPRPTPPPPPRRRPTVLVRHDVASAQGQAMLQRYEEAVRRMRALRPRDPNSWQYQWFVHASPRARNIEIDEAFDGAAPPARALAERTWATCRHGDEAYFLPWHRMYLYYFERICRRVLGDETFTLPYWDYGNGSRVLPALFRSPASPLYSRDRNPGINNGDSIIANQPPEVASQINYSEALSRPTFITPTIATSFSEVLEQRPHNVVHGLIGNDRGMGSVQWSAQDPIFWLHHCNIDRLWASWNAAGRRNPGDAAWLARRFPFADENGRLAEAVVRDFVGTAARGYRYDRLETLPATRAGESIADADAEEPTSARSIAMATQRRAAPPGGIPLGGQAIMVSLPSVAPARESEDAGESGRGARRTFLVLRNYRAQADTSVLYHVYLALPTGTRGAAAGRHYVGALSFFGASPMPGHAGHFTGRTVRFDVTDVIRRLRSEGRFTGMPSVTIAPAGQPAASAQPVIGEISLVEG